MNRLITRPEFRFMWGVSVTCVLLAGLAAFAWNAAVLDKSPPISNLKGEAISIEKRRDGSRQMIVRWTGTRQRHCVGTSQRWLVNGYIHPLPDSSFPAREIEKIGDPVDNKVSVIIPADFPAHLGQYHVVTSYQCNALQVQFPKLLSVVVRLPPVQFDLTGEVR